MKGLIAILASPGFLLVAYLVCGLFSAIFAGVLWMLANHPTISVVMGIGLWLIVAFFIRVLIERMQF